MTVQSYISSIGEAASFTGVAMPIDLPKVPGVALFGDAGMPVLQLWKNSLATSLADVLPFGTIEDMANGMLDALGPAMEVAGAFAGAVGPAFGMFQAAVGFSKAVGDYISKLEAATTGASHESFFLARKEVLQKIMNSGDPSDLWESEWYGDRFTRVTSTAKSLGTARIKRSYPAWPVFPPAVQWTNAVKAGTTRKYMTKGAPGPSTCDVWGPGNRGQATAGKWGGSSCVGQYRLFLALYPAYHPELLASQTAHINFADLSKAGLVSRKSGESLLPTILTLRALAVGDPTTVLSADMRPAIALRDRVINGVLSFVDRVEVWEDPRFTPGTTKIVTKKKNEVWDIQRQPHRIDLSFDKDNPLSGLYWTPDGLIGAYQSDGSGSTSDPNLTKILLSMARTKPKNAASSTGMMSARDYNAIVSAVNSALAFRVALLRRKSFLVDFVKRGGLEARKSAKGKTYQVREPKVRAAILAATSKRTSSKKVGGSRQTYRLIPPSRIGKPRRRSTGVAAPVAVGVSAAALFFILR